MAKDQEQDQKEQEKQAKEREEGMEERREHRQKTEGGEVTSNGEFTKVIRDGKVEIVPTSEIYAKEPEDRVEGLEVEDRTVTAVAAGGPSLQDRLERKFHKPERGDEVSAHHATGPTGSGVRGGKDLKPTDDDPDSIGEEEKKGGKKKGK